MPHTTLTISSIGNSAGAPKPGIANLKLKQPSGRTFPDDTAAKGGEGGESGEPPLPLSNAKFLASVMRDVADGATAVICSKTDDPTSGDWTAIAAGEVDTQCPGTRNNYVNCSSFVTAADGPVKARKDSLQMARGI